MCCCFDLGFGALVFCYACDVYCMCSVLGFWLRVCWCRCVSGFGFPVSWLLGWKDVWLELLGLGYFVIGLWAFCFELPARSVGLLIVGF